MRQAAQGDVVYNDDTVMKFLELMNQSDEERHGRKGMCTYGILSTVDGRKMAVFIAGAIMRVKIWPTYYKKELRRIYFKSVSAAKIGRLIHK